MTLGVVAVEAGRRRRWVRSGRADAAASVAGRASWLVDVLPTDSPFRFLPLFSSFSLFLLALFYSFFCLILFAAPPPPPHPIHFICVLSSFSSRHWRVQQETNRPFVSEPVRASKVRDPQVWPRQSFDYSSGLLTSRAGADGP